MKQNQASQKNIGKMCEMSWNQPKIKPRIAAILKSKKGPEKPRIDDNQPDLL